MLTLKITLNPNATLHVRDAKNQDIFIAATLNDIMSYININVKPDPNFDPDKYTVK